MRRGRRFGAVRRPDLWRWTLSQLFSSYTFSRFSHWQMPPDKMWFTVVAGLVVLFCFFFRRSFPYFLDDCIYILKSLQFGVRLIKYRKFKPFYSIVDCFLDAAKRHPNKVFLLFEGQEYSYGDVDKRSNKVARALQAAVGLKGGETVALFLANEPSVVWTWLGLAKLGCPAALLNFNIRSKSLLHCFSCCGAKVIITSAGKREGTRSAFPSGVPGTGKAYICSRTCSYDPLRRPDPCSGTHGPKERNAGQQIQLPVGTTTVNGAAAKTGSCYSCILSMFLMFLCCI